MNIPTGHPRNARRAAGPPLAASWLSIGCSIHAGLLLAASWLSIGCSIHAGLLLAASWLSIGCSIHPDIESPVTSGGQDAGPVGPGGDAMSDATSPDATLTDGSEPSEGASPTATDAPVCRPLIVLTNPPSAPVTVNPPSTACNGFNGDGGLVQSFGDACLGRAANYDSCAQFAVPTDPDAGACYSCLVTAMSDAGPYGPVVRFPVPVANYAACIAAVDPSAAGANCALAVADSYNCSGAACSGAACAVVDENSRAGFLACTDEANTSTCLASYLTAEGCLVAERGDGGTAVASVCFPGNSAEDHYFGMAHYFCGAN